MEISLNKDSIVNQQTGEVSEPSEYLANLRALERTIATCDHDIEGLKSDLLTAKKARERAISALRSAVRSGEVLPLLELAEQGDGENTDEENNDDEGESRIPRIVNKNDVIDGWEDE